jgi:hypothetical protein
MEGPKRNPYAAPELLISNGRRGPRIQQGEAQALASPATAHRDKLLRRD